MIISNEETQMYVVIKERVRSAQVSKNGREEKGSMNWNQPAHKYYCLFGFFMKFE